MLMQHHLKLSKPTKELKQQPPSTYALPTELQGMLTRYALFQALSDFLKKRYICQDHDYLYAPLVLNPAGLKFGSFSPLDPPDLDDQ